MSDNPPDESAQLQAEIALLARTIESLAALPDAQAPLRAQLAEKQHRLDALRGGVAGPPVGSIGAGRDVYIATQQTINQVFGGAPPPNGERLLADYLETVADECDQLRLYRLTGKRQTGGDARAVPALRLERVFTNLTTDGPSVVVRERQRPAGKVVKLLNRLRRWDYSPDAVEPLQVRAPGIKTGVSRRSAGSPGERNEVLLEAQAIDRLLEQLVATEPESTPPLTLCLTRPLLALEAIVRMPRLVLLGEPGAGKSTALRYLTLRLAQRACGRAAPIPGWPDDLTLLPLICPLGAVAALLSAAKDLSDAAAGRALWQALGDVLDGSQGLRAGLRDHLQPALRRGGVLLLFDGLDELPSGPRNAVARAVARLAEQIPGARIVVTCRVLPYRAPGSWQLPEDRWAVQTIQPLAFGQVRAFIASWYRTLASEHAELDASEAERRIAALTGEFAARDRLRPLVASPLLLTMLAILHYNTNEVPADRARLYEECVVLLLDRWEPVRTPGQERPGLPERIGLPQLDVDQLRLVIHRLAYMAHERPPEDDGRGMLDGLTMEAVLLRFFRDRGASDPNAVLLALKRALAEDAGLLQERADDRFAFPHLTFQEYLAACHLADQSDLVDVAYRHWSGADSSRWREPLLLLAARLRRQGPKSVERDGVPWLKLLTSQRVGKQPKATPQRLRDAVLAASSYRELDVAKVLDSSVLDIEQEVVEPLRAAIVDVLRTPEASIATPERIDAARVLGELGDPRYPVATEAWRAELTRRNERFGQPEGYLCYVPAGTYRIGGWEEGEETVDLPLPSFWIARLPVTVAQYAPFVAEGYGPDTERWWTPEGWTWKEADSRTQPWRWDDPQYTQPNQPVSGVTWYEATAYCAWLNERLEDALLPGYVLRLPTEAEWESAAAFDAVGSRCTYPWGEAQPGTDLAVIKELQLDAPAPVGCCPAGMAASGALEMAGNNIEWTSSSYAAYPAGAAAVQEDFTKSAGDVPYRSSHYREDETLVRCGARSRLGPYNVSFGLGFRVVLAPKLAR